ncbi:unnamed protein product [Urochloa decumbens]|uniref:Peptidase A1 domain-containing protein n=1 Tax=Urochloa decumbens TaxID=240449 RepID=A0ABC9BA37_9POAL
MASVPKLLVLLFLCSCHSLAAHAGDDHQSYKFLPLDSLKSDGVCSEPKAVPLSGAATLPLHHRHGPCSPLTDKKMPTLEEMLRRDQLRAAYIQRKFSSSDANGSAGDAQQSDATVPTNLGTYLNTLQYVISVSLGSPAMDQTVFIDTGSDISWLQCEPCSQCHSQADPLFDPSASSTYSPFSCSSDTCAQLGRQGNGCSSSQCQYIVRYVDGSSTTGTYSSDTLALGSNTVSNFQFGCSDMESGLLLNDQTDGLMGLGGGTQSLVSQTTGTFGSAFSYCLPPTASSSGFLTLGAPTSGSFVTTPMIRFQNNPTFYGVRLEAIRVGGSQLNIPTSVFSAMTIMDSGTIVTRLPRTAYSALSSAFRDGMAQYPSAPPNGILDTCFDFSGQSSVTIPSVALVFSGGAFVDLDYYGIMLENCLAFAGNRDDYSSLNIIGNVQQRTFEVLYDVSGSTVGFRAAAC